MFIYLICAINGQWSLLHGRKWEFPWFMRRLFLTLSTCTSMIGLSRETSHRCLHVPAMVMCWPGKFAQREKSQILVVHKSILYEGIRLHFGALSDLCLINIWHKWVTFCSDGKIAWCCVMLTKLSQNEMRHMKRDELLGEETFRRDVACWFDKGKALRFFQFEDWGSISTKAAGQTLTQLMDMTRTVLQSKIVDKRAWMIIDCLWEPRHPKAQSSRCFCNNTKWSWHDIDLEVRPRSGLHCLAVRRECYYEDMRKGSWLMKWNLNDLTRWSKLRTCSKL